MAKYYNYNLTVKMTDGTVDEWTDNYSHGEFIDDIGKWFVVFHPKSTENCKSPIAWYNTQYVVSIVMKKTEYEG